MNQLIVLSDIIDGTPIINGVAIRRIFVDEKFINKIPFPNNSGLKEKLDAEDIAKIVAHAVANKSEKIVPNSSIEDEVTYKDQEYTEMFTYYSEDGIIKFNLSIGSTVRILGIYYNLTLVGTI